MKILILSDSHNDIGTMRDIICIEKPDAVIHLGDHMADADKLSGKYPDIQVYKVPGNTDSKKKDEEWVKYTEICGKRIMLTHGHTFLENAKTHFEGITKMFLSGQNNADIILFGHTHEPFINCCNRKWIMNPGRIGHISSKTIHSTYGILEIESGNINWEIREVDNI
ncbi:MAG: YfcE family phosphodiesterase [Oscillospiraceae bacterium]|nr:YfcE family phosphodiesterase [Oscillospiraceae bacterium]